MIHEISHSPGRVVRIDGEEYLYFGGTAYLGTSTNREFIDLYKEQLNEYGPAFGASRKGNVQLAVYREAEEYLAAQLNAPASILLSSGYLAGQLCADHFSETGYRIFLSPYCHSALRSGNLKNYQDFKAMKASILELLAAKKNAPIPVIFTDAINLTGDGVDILEELKALPLSKCILVADDSHGIGILGDKGMGMYKSLKELRPLELILNCSLGKAAGIHAGVVVGERSRIESLKENRIYAGASPPSPIAMATYIKAEKLYENAKKALEAHMEMVHEALKGNRHLAFMERHPSIGIKTPGLIGHLKANGIVVSNFKYEGDSATQVGRLVISAAHKESDIKTLIEIIRAFEPL